MVRSLSSLGEERWRRSTEGAESCLDAFVQENHVITKARSDWSEIFRRPLEAFWKVLLGAGARAVSGPNWGAVVVRGVGEGDDEVEL